jgi:acylglycerol lipase
VLGFATEGRDQHTDAFKHVSGVIATSPLIQQTTPASKLLRWAGGKLAVLFPTKLMDAEVKSEVRRLWFYPTNPYLAQARNLL